MKRRVHLILLAGGTGSRFGESRPKQFAQLLGKTVLSYSLERLLAWLDGLEGPHGPDSFWQKGIVVLVTHGDFEADVRALLESHGEGGHRVLVTTGGATRHLSSIQGLRALGEAADEDVILIHDTARPYVPRQDLDALLQSFRVASGGPAALAASLVSATSETLVEGDGGWLRRGLDRNHIYAVKTPQALSGRLRRRFLEGEDRPEFTDLLRWAELCGVRASLVTGSPLNIKLTTPEDRLLLEAVLYAERAAGPEVARGAQDSGES